MIALENVLRPDEPRPSWSRDEVLERAPGSGRRLLPRPLAAGVDGRRADRSDGRGGGRADPLRRLSRDEYFDAYREAAAGDSLNAFLWTAEDAAQADLEGPGGRDERRAPARGIPVAVKDIFCTEGIPTTAGSRILEGYRPPYTATAVRKLREAGARVLGKANMDEFAMGSSNENSGYGPVLNPWDPGPGPGRLLGRLARRRSPAGSRPARSAPTPAARSASRPRSAGSSA